MLIKRLIKPIVFFFRRIFTKNLEQTLQAKSLEPISRKFGFDLGTPIDRVYTDDFLSKNSHHIKGVVCEIAENTYTLKYGSNITKSEILHVSDTTHATIIGDLTKHHTLPSGTMDCFICTVTLNFIFDYKEAIKGIYQMLKEGGVALISVAGLVQISRYDYTRWGDYWRFTDMGIEQAVKEVFGDKVTSQTYGNIRAAMGELQGMPAEKFSHEELFFRDPDYQILITLVAQK